jgi:hypothetical protein
MAKIYPFTRRSELPWRQEMHELKNAFAAEYLAFFILALDTCAKTGGATPQGLQVMQRAYALLTAARNQLELEYK